MKPDWKIFLKDNGAEFDDCERVVSFGNPAREARAALGGTVFADLSHQGLISAHGPDTQTFLQGQFTNDTRAVDEGHSQLSAYCNPKGRMLANFRLFQRGDTWYLRLPQELVETVLQRLRLFVLRADVTLEEASDAFVRIGLSGPDAEAELEAAVGAVPAAIDEVVHTDDCTVIRVPGVQPRFEIYSVLEGTASKIWDKLNVRCAPVGSDTWELLDILAGIPTIYPETADLFVPQMANLQLVGGVSFKKGCYTGQEVVARMQYLGKLKRRMYRVRIMSDDPVPRAADIFSPQDPGQSAGKVVNAQLHPDGGYAALAVIQITAADASDLHLGKVDGPEVRLEELPYSFEPAEAS